MSRPQDIFTSLAPFRPAFLVSMIVLSFFMFSFIDSFLYPQSSSQTSISSTQTTLYTALICIMIIGVPFAVYRKGAFLFVSDYIMKVALFYFIFIRMVDTVRKLERVLLVGCFGTGFYAYMAIMQGILKGQRLTFGRMFDPNDLAFFSLSFLPFNFLFISKENQLHHRIFAIFSVLSSILVILMSGSRGGFIAFLAVVIFLFVKKSTSIKSWHKIILMVLGITIIGSNLILVDFSRYKTITNLDSDYNFTSETGRIRVWKEALSFMIANPLTGVGVDCFPEALGTKRSQDGSKPRWQTTHNSFLLIGAETGLIGFVLFVLMNFNSFRIFWHAEQKGISEKMLKIGEMAKIGFVGHLICIMFLSQTYSFYWIFYIALSCVLQKFRRTEVESGLIDVSNNFRSSEARL